MASLEEKIATNLRKGVLEYCVLAILRNGRRYGLDLAKELHHSALIGGEGTLYPLLSRLRNAGLVDAEWITSQPDRPRRYYTLTAAGNDYLASFHTVWASLSETVNELLKDPS